MQTKDAVTNFGQYAQMKSNNSRKNQVTMHITSTVSTMKGQKWHLGERTTLYIMMKSVSH